MDDSTVTARGPSEERATGPTGGAGSWSGLSVLFELFAASQRTRALLAEAMQDADVTAVEYAVYSLIDDLGRASPTELAARLGFPVTTMLDHLRILEARDHLDRRPNPDDGRSYLVTLNEDGHRAFVAAREHFDLGMQRLLANLDSDEETLRHGLRDLGMAAEAALADLRRTPDRSAQETGN